MNTTHQSIIICLLGSISGFNVMISGNSLNYWLASEGIDIKTIGMFAFILLPYSINFIWAPIFDSYKIKFLAKIFGARVSWVFIITILLALCTFTLGLINPNNNLTFFAIFSLLISFFSSTQDSLLGALKTEIINSKDQGKISGIYIFGYRIGMLMSGSLAIYVSSFIAFNIIYKFFAAIIVLKTLILMLLLKNIKSIEHSIEKNKNILLLIKVVLKSVGHLSFIISILIFLVFYRMGDNFINIMINPFLIELGFNASEIASAGKFLGVIGALIGGFIASNIMKKHSILDSLLLFGTLHAAGHGLFIIQELYGNNMYILFIVIGFEAITGGMSMAAYIALISSLCQGAFKATKYSFFSSMMGLSRAIFPSISGYIVTLFGWKIFFTFTILISIPSLILLILFKKYLASNNIIK